MGSDNWGEATSEALCGHTLRRSSSEAVHGMMIAGTPAAAPTRRPATPAGKRGAEESGKAKRPREARACRRTRLGSAEATVGHSTVNKAKSRGTKKGVVQAGGKIAGTPTGCGGRLLRRPAVVALPALGVAHAEAPDALRPHLVIICFAQMGNRRSSEENGCGAITQAADSSFSVAATPGRPRDAHGSNTLSDACTKRKQEAEGGREGDTAPSFALYGRSSSSTFFFFVRVIHLGSCRSCDKGRQMAIRGSATTPARGHPGTRVRGVGGVG